MPRQSGLVAQVRASIEQAGALGKPFVLYTEPDKERFLTSQIDDFIAKSPAIGADVVLAARTDESFATFPPMQQYTERVFNYLCGNMLERPGDYTYGPFLMRAMLLDLLNDMPEHLGWGWRPCFFHAAHRRGARLGQVDGEYPCPVDQRREIEEDRRHRLRQLAENISGLIA